MLLVCAAYGFCAGLVVLYCMVVFRGWPTVRAYERAKGISSRARGSERFEKREGVNC